MRGLSLFILAIAATLSAAAPVAPGGHEVKFVKESLTNSQRFRRGLPPKAPFRRYNATATRNHLARRSAESTIAYIQATPLTPPVSKRAMDELEERASSPVTDISWAHWDSNLYQFVLSSDPTLATPFTILSDSTDQMVGFPFTGGTLNMCLFSYSVASGSMDTSPSTAVVFDGCYPADSTVDDSWGSGVQVPIWNTPSAFPGPASINYHNADHTDSNPTFWMFDSTQGSHLLGAAMAYTDFGTPYSDKDWQPMSLQWVLET